MRYGQFIGYGVAAGLAIFLLLPGSVQAEDSSARWPDPIAAEVLPYRMAGLTHGPVVGRPTATTMQVWVRTREPGPFDVVYDTRLPLSKQSGAAQGRTLAERDNTGAVQLTGVDGRHEFRLRRRAGAQDEYRQNE